jgi:hypothetical protein
LGGGGCGALLPPPNNAFKFKSGMPKSGKSTSAARAGAITAASAIAAAMASAPDCLFMKPPMAFDQARYCKRNKGHRIT